MDSAATLNSGFLGRVSTSRNDVIASMEQKLEAEKVELIKGALADNGIEYDPSVLSYEGLIRSLKTNLSGDRLEAALQICDAVNMKMNYLLESLKNGSCDSMSNFINNNVSSDSVGIISPDIANQRYALSKSSMKGLVLTRDKALDNIITELEITRSSDGAILDTRFSPDVQTLIKDFLKQRGVSFDETGYMSLIYAVRNLNEDEKEQLCRILKDRLGRHDIDIDARLKGKGDSILAKAKDLGSNAINIVKGGVVGGALFGAGAYGVSKLAKADAVTGVINKVPSLATVGKNAFQKIADSGVVTKAVELSKKFAGVIAEKTTILKGSSFLPNGVSVLPGLDKNPIFTTFVPTAIIGAGVGVAFIVGKKVISKIKGWMDRKRRMKELDNAAAIDSLKYSGADDNEVSVMRSQMNMSDANQTNQVLVELVTDYIVDELGVKLTRRPNDFNELCAVISGLDDKDKKKVTAFLTGIQSYNTTRKEKLKNILKKVGKGLVIAGAIGLTSITAWNLLKGNAEALELLQNIQGRVGQFFKDVKTKALGKTKEALTVTGNAIGELAENITSKNGASEILDEAANTAAVAVGSSGTLTRI